MAHEVYYISCDLLTSLTLISLIVYWQDLKSWEPKRIGALILYIAVIFFSCQRLFLNLGSFLSYKSKKQLTEAYMEALIPQPSPANIKKYIIRNFTVKFFSLFNIF